MSAPRSVSVLMPIFQGERFLPRVLEALASQRFDRPWNFLAADCGSTDATLGIFAEFAKRFPVPLRVRGIAPGEFDHGDTRNLLAGLSDGELLVFITDDAIPTSDEWLATLVSNFDDAEVGGAYCRNLARPEAPLLARLFSEGDPNYAAERREERLPPRDVYARLDPDQRRLLFNFCDTASAVRRELWERHPYPRCNGAEDVIMARGMIEAGYSVIYENRVPVWHSHEYNVDQMRNRALTDGRANAAWFGRRCIATAEDAELQAAAQLAQDRRALEEGGMTGADLETQLSRSAELRHTYFAALHEGSRTRLRKPPRAMRPDARVAVLLVVRGPLEENSTTAHPIPHVARGLRQRGHRATILVWPEEGIEHEAGCSLEEDDLDGTPVWRARRESEVPGRSPAHCLQEVVARTGSELIHFHDLAGFDLTWLDSLECRDLPRLLSLDGDGAESREALRLALSADVLVTTDRPSCDALRQVEGVDRDEILYSSTSRTVRPPDPDGLPDADVVQWESRYRSMLCRDWTPRPSTSVPGSAGAIPERSPREERGEVLVLDAAGAAAEYELGPLPGREREIRLFIPTTPGETQLERGGRILADGVEVARLEPATGGEQAALRAVVLRTRFPTEAKRLRIESRGGENGEASLLRIAWLEVRQPAATSNGVVLVDRAGSDTATTEGPHGEPESGGILLGPEPAAVSYSLAPTGIGPRELYLYVSVEADTVQGGVLFVDGEEIGRLGPLRPASPGSGDGGELRGIRCRLELDRPPRELRIKNQIGEDEAPTRLWIRRVQVCLPEVPTSFWSSLMRRAHRRWRVMLRRPFRLDR